MIIGLSAGIAAGKGEAVKYFEEMGFEKVSLSDVIRDVLKSLNIPESRQALQIMGNMLRKAHGNDYLAREAVTKITDWSKPIVIDSIRNPSEIDFLKSNYAVFMIGIDTSGERRLSNYAKREREGDQISPQNFIEADNFEYREDANDHEIQINRCLLLCDVVIENNGSLEEFRAKLYSITQNLGI